MYRTYSRRLAELLAKNGSQVWYYSMDFGTASHVLDQSAAFDGAWRDDALFPGIALEERRKTAEIIYESYVRPTVFLSQKRRKAWTLRWRI